MGTSILPRLLAAIMLSLHIPLSFVSAAELIECKRESPESTISYCTELINLGDAAKEQFWKWVATRASAYVDVQQFDKAIADYSTLVEMEPDWVPTRAVRADLYYKTDNWPAAISDMNFLISKEPKNVDFLRMRALANSELRNFQKSFDDWNTLVDIYPLDNFNYLQRGGALFALQRFELAIQDFKKFIDLEPRNAVGHVFLSASHIQMGNKLAAEEAFLSAYQVGGGKFIIDIYLDLKKNANYTGSINFEDLRENWLSCVASNHCSYR